MSDANKDVLYLQVRNIAEKIIVTGEKPTIDRVHELLGSVGSKHIVAKHLRKWLKEHGKDIKQFEKDDLQNFNNPEKILKLFDKRTEELKNSLSLVRATLESTADGIIMIDNKGRLVDWNQKFIEMARIPKEVLEKGDEKAGLRHMLKQVNKPWKLVKLMIKLRLSPSTEGVVGEVNMKDGRIVERYSQPHKVAGNIVGRVWSFRDITEQRKAEDALRLRERAILASTHGVVIAKNDLDLTVEYANPAFEKITGYNESDIVGKSFLMLHSGSDAHHQTKLVQEAVGRQKEEQVVIQCMRKDGVLFWNEMHMAPVPNAHGKIDHYVLILNDITGRKAMEEQLMHQATHDALTDLPNRTLLQDRISQSILFAKRNEGTMQVLFIDLDRFKNINDGLGHRIGDHLLRMVSSRIKKCIRATDTVARIGGDEFVVVLSPLDSVESGVRIAQKILATIRDPYKIEDRELNITTSLGISCFPKDGTDPDTLVRNADTAMYHAKDSGRDNFQFFTEDLNKLVSQRLLIENNLRRALEKDEFILHYQPIYNLETGKVASLEVLIRWDSPAMGRVSPLEFIPIAEEMGLIVPIGEWVLREACKQTVKWQKMGIEHLQIAVNVSGKQLQKPFFMSTVQSALNDSRLNPKNLVLEITESILMDQSDDAVDKLHKLRELDIKLAIDDFGTGYSSLSYLSRFPVNKLKIDRAFISKVGADGGDNAITLAILAMGKSLNLTIVAEGMQTKRQLEFLKQYNCDEVQGFYFSKPLDVESCTRLLRENHGLLGED